MSIDDEIAAALNANDTKKYIQLKKQSAHFQAFSKEERTIKVDGESLILDAGTEAPWLSGLGACLIRVYDIRRNEKGQVEFGIGNETLPILGYVSAKAFFNEWPA